MSTPGEEPEAAVEQLEPAGEPGGMSERTAKVVLLAILMGAIWGIVAVLPETAYFVTGILACRGWQKAHNWITERGSSDGDTDEPDYVLEVENEAQLTREQLVQALHTIGAPHAHTSALAEHLGTTSERVRDALDEAGITRSGGVRMKGRKVAVSPGVKREDFPPLPSPTQDGPVEGVLTSNNNSNNAFETVPDEVNPVRTHVRWRAR